MLKISFLLSIIILVSLNANKLNELKEKQYMLAGVKYDFKPFGFINDKGMVDGFDVDLIKYIATKLNLDVKFKQVTSTNRIKMLLEGKVDILAASMTHTQSRDKLIDFSISYFFDKQAMLVSRKEEKHSYKEFDNSKIGAIKGSTSGENFQKLLPNVKIIYFNEYPQALRSLKRGHINAITTDMAWCKLQAKESNGELKVLDNLYIFEPYGIGIVQNESIYLDAINNAIQNSVNDGTYANIYEKWFGEVPSRLPVIWPK